MRFNVLLCQWYVYLSEILLATHSNRLEVYLIRFLVVIHFLDSKFKNFFFTSADLSRTDQCSEDQC